MIKKQTKGFSSLLFLLILLGIGILAGVGIYLADPLKSYFQNQDMKRKNDLQQIKKALQYYYRDFGKYPDYDDETFTIILSDGKKEWGEEWKPYMEFIPKDPAFYKQYGYWADRSNNLQTFRLYTSLDRADLDNTSCGESGCSNAPRGGMCGANFTCNYGVTSGNISP